MPKVTLIGTNGRRSTSSGGCFGFTGRSGTTSGFEGLSRLLEGDSKIDTFRYYIGDNWGDDQTVRGLRDPIPYIKWIVEGSPWAKYFKGSNFPNDRLDTSDNCYVDIRCDVPGHCVIGAASAVRLASHRRSCFIPRWNMAVNAGADPAIAMLVFYAVGQSIDNDIDINMEGVMARKSFKNRPISPSADPSGMLSLGDDEVMRLTNVAPGLIYSFIKGDFEMLRDDSASEHKYEIHPSYDQEILNSFSSRSNHRNRKNFGHFLKARFHTVLPKADTHKFSTGMGATTSIQVTRKAPVSVSTVIGWTLQLSSEFAQYGRFLGWRA